MQLLGDAEPGAQEEAGPLRRASLGSFQRVELASHVSSFRALLADRTLITAANEEGLRLYSPVPGLCRTVMADVDFAGEALSGSETDDYTVAFHDALPREDSGKIFKRRLRAPYWEKSGRKI